MGCAALVQAGNTRFSHHTAAAWFAAQMSCDCDAVNVAEMKSVRTCNWPSSPVEFVG